MDVCTATCLTSCSVIVGVVCATLCRRGASEVEEVGMEGGGGGGGGGVAICSAAEVLQEKAFQALI